MYKDPATEASELAGQVFKKVVGMKWAWRHTSGLDHRGLWQNVSMIIFLALTNND